MFCRCRCRPRRPAGLVFDRRATRTPFAWSASREPPTSARAARLGKNGSRSSTLPIFLNPRHDTNSGMRRLCLPPCSRGTLLPVAHYHVPPASKDPSSIPSRPGRGRDLVLPRRTIGRALSTALELVPLGTTIYRRLRALMDRRMPRSAARTSLPADARTIRTAIRPSTSESSRDTRRSLAASACASARREHQQPRERRARSRFEFVRPAPLQLLPQSNHAIARGASSGAKRAGRASTRSGASRLHSGSCILRTFRASYQSAHRSRNTLFNL